MKFLKKIIVIALIASLLISAFCFSASAMVIYDGDFGFEIDSSSNEAKLVRYNGKGGVVTIPDYFQGYPVTVIGRNAFARNESITDLVFSGTNTTVEEYSFINCTSLKSVYIPENVTSFGDRVFSGCTSLESATMLSDIVSMPTNIFSGCTSLCDVTLNDKIADFGYGCFNGCSSLKNADFISNGVMIQSYAFNGTGLESVVLSDLLLAVPDYAFTNCDALKSVTIPESVMLIQPNAFDFEETVILCEYGSFAYDFAAEHEYPYQLTDGVLLGDSDGSGFADINDVTHIQRHIAGLKKVEGIYFRASDTNLSGDIDITDATTLQKYLAEYELPYPIGEPIYK